MATLRAASIPFVVARTADQRAARSVDDAHGSARLDGSLEVGGKGLALIAILVRMLLPDQRVRRHGEQGLEVARSERFELYISVFKPRL